MMQLPLYPTLESARLAADGCVACGRADGRTQVVFGHGNPDARLMLIGEAPSSTDDDTGKPFTGPAGKLLDALLRDLGVHRRDLWITNLVRCFDGGMKNGRMKNRPARVSEIKACAMWRDLEIRYVNPRVILAVGAPAAKHIIGSDFRLKEQHGEIFELPDGRKALATVQPAYVMRLKAHDEDAHQLGMAQLIDDLRIAVRAAELG